MEQAARIELVSQPWQGRIITIILCLRMERVEGIEPSSIVWKTTILTIILHSHGAGDRNRTRNLDITSVLRYLLRHSGINVEPRSLLVLFED